MKLLLKISIITLFCVLAVNANAQIATPIDGVTIQTSNTDPRPGDNVSVYVESYNINLNSSSIVWLVDGKVQSQGVGIKQIDIKAPKIGSKTTITSNIKAPDGREIKKVLTITTGAVDIIWESNGYVPPFFKGRLPFAYQNSVRLIAMPHLAKDAGKEIDPKTLVYSWKLGGKYIESGQGYGKQSVEIQADDIPRTLEISVDVSNREQTLHTFGSINLEPTEPSLSFYEEDPLYGIYYNKSISSDVTMKNSEMKILAIPFGFNMDKMLNEYSWSINNIDQPDLVKNRSITIRTKGDIDGSSNINLRIRNQDNILQGADGQFTVYFNKRK